MTVDLALIWAGPGVDQNTVQLSSNGTTLELTFNPLRTSHGGVYSCDARFNISEADVAELTSNSTLNVTVQSEFMFHACIGTTSLISLQFQLQFCLLWNIPFLTMEQSLL